VNLSKSIELGQTAVNICAHWTSPFGFLQVNSYTINCLLIIKQDKVCCVLDEKKNADLWLLNSCTVKSPAEDHFRNEINLAKQLEKYIVIAGCVPQGQPKGDYMQV
jgi:tRNA A37 methylthiotransferase MiaB